MKTKLENLAIAKSKSSIMERAQEEIEIFGLLNDEEVKDMADLDKDIFNDLSAESKYEWICLDNVPPGSGADDIMACFSENWNIIVADAVKVVGNKALIPVNNKNEIEALIKSYDATKPMGDISINERKEIFESGVETISIFGFQNKIEDQSEIGIMNLFPTSFRPTKIMVFNRNTFKAHALCKFELGTPWNKLTNGSYIKIGNTILRWSYVESTKVQAVLVGLDAKDIARINHERFVAFLRKAHNLKVERIRTPKDRRGAYQEAITLFFESARDRQDALGRGRLLKIRGKLCRITRPKWEKA